jgi:hypothetical protein
MACRTLFYLATKRGGYGKPYPYDISTTKKNAAAEAAASRFAGAHDHAPLRCFREVHYHFKRTPIWICRVE